eukprot:tig00021037_g17433.t1
MSGADPAHTTEAMLAVMPDPTRTHKWSQNPCNAAAQASYDCLAENQHNKKACEKYFDEYKKCKTAMMEARKKLRQQQQ